MAGDMPMALRRTPRRQQHGVGETAAPRTPASTASQRRSPRVNAPRKPAATKNAMLPRTTAGKSMARKRSDKSKAGVTESAASVADDATDDSVTLVDDDSITALDFDIPISSSRRSASGANSNNNTNKRKRLSTASTATTTPAIKRARRQTDDNTNNNSIIHILPLRTQILDDHIKRRIRRNGLSAEMNDAYGEKRARRQRTLAELRRARDELADRDAEIERLRELTALFDQQGGDHSQHHVQELEVEISRLREQVSSRQGRRGDDEVPFSSSPPVARGDDDDGWGVMGGMSDDGSDAGGDFDNDEEFGEASLAELESGGTTPGQQRRQQQQQQQRKPTGGKRPTALHLHGPTLTPPSTSPAKLPSSPVRQIHSSGSSSSTACDAGVQAANVSVDASSQACIPDPEMTALHEELNTLRAEVSSLSDTLLERDSLQSRLGDKLAQHQQAEGDDSDVELQLDIVLQDLADKTARLGELSSLLTPSSTTTAVVDKEATAQLSTALQSVRDALADMESETPLPETAASTLNLASARLRELDTSLSQQKTELTTYEASLAAAEARAAAKDKTATNLSLDIAHLAETIASLREELDTLQEHSASQALDLDSARDAALQSKTAAAEAEARLAEAGARIATLSKQLSEREGALRDREGEVDRLRTELAEAGVTIAKLREGNAREVGRSREVVRAMRAQMVAALRMGDGFLGDVETATQGVAKEEVESEGGVDVEMDKADRGRSDDSGLGLDGEMQLV